MHFPHCYKATTITAVILAKPEAPYLFLSRPTRSLEMLQPSFVVN
jgi:hypothetical protein